jgi:hypothetical protein
MNNWTSLDGASLRWKPYHQNTTRRFATKRYLSVLVGTKFCEPNTKRHLSALIETLRTP